MGRGAAACQGTRGPGAPRIGPGLVDLGPPVLEPCEALPYCGRVGVRVTDTTPVARGRASASVTTRGGRRHARFQAAVRVGAAALLFGGSYLVLAPFLVGITWAAVLALATWPVYRGLRAALGQRDSRAAPVMTLLVVLAIAGPAVALSVSLADDVATLARTLSRWAVEPPDLPEWVGSLPLVGPTLAGWHAAFRANPGSLQRLALERAPAVGQTVVSMAGDVGRNLFHLAMTLLTVYFFYRHGDELVAQLRRVLRRLGGEPVERTLDLVGGTVRAVVYGVLLTAIVQGCLAGLAFWALGVGRAALLGSLTALLAPTPIGPVFVWGPVAVWLFATGLTWKGVVLIVWSTLVVGTVDNVLRPLLIGGHAQIPFLLLIFGVLGGAAAFGFLGLFVGPVVLAVLVALWREWAAPLPEPAEAPAP